jgi:ABC-type glycerol-3-phosphate transport system permease component
MKVMTASRPAWTKRITPVTITFYLVIAIFLFVSFAPIYWIILSAVTPITELFRSPLDYFPSHLSFINFQTVVQVVPLGQEFLNSTVLALGSAAISVAVCTVAAYAFARIDFPGRNVLFMALLLSGFLPVIATIIPLFQMFQNLSLVDSLWGILILIVSALLPLSIWIMTAFVRQIPVELEEAAQVDGAGFVSLFVRIILPILRPSLATIFLINFITAWDEFFFPLIFSRTSATSTLTLGITQAAVNPQYQQVAWGNEAAMGLIVIGPVFILALAFQKQIIEGLMAGALKG